MAFAEAIVDSPRMPKGPYRRGAAVRRRHVGNFIREWREYRDLTQERVAELTGLSVPTISNTETGAAGYSRRSLELLAKALGCTPGDLLSRRPEEDDLAARIAALPDQDRENIRDFVAVLSARNR